MEGSAMQMREPEGFKRKAEEATHLEQRPQKRQQATCETQATETAPLDTSSSTSNNEREKLLERLREKEDQEKVEAEKAATIARDHEEQIASLRAENERLRTGLSDGQAECLDLHGNLFQCFTQANWAQHLVQDELLAASRANQEILAERDEARQAAAAAMRSKRRAVEVLDRVLKTRQTLVDNLSEAVQEKMRLASRLQAAEEQLKHFRDAMGEQNAQLAHALYSRRREALTASLALQEPAGGGGFPDVDRQGEAPPNHGEGHPSDDELASYEEYDSSSSSESSSDLSGDEHGESGGPLPGEITLRVSATGRRRSPFHVNVSPLRNLIWHQLCRSPRLRR